VLPLDHDQDRRIAASVHRRDVQCGSTVGEDSDTLELTAPVRELNRGSAVGRGQGEAGRVMDQVETAVHVAPHPCIRRLCGLIDQLASVAVMIGSRW
jgi:hypothetical protein